MHELADWESFYVIVGSAAGALIGLQFVVMTLITQRTDSAPPEAGQAFSTPTVLHFAVVLFLSALSRVPWGSMTAAAICWGCIGAAGLGYTAYVFTRIRRQDVYKPVFEDWLFHVLIPFASYAVLLVSALWSGSVTKLPLFGVGACALLLLFVGIHNAWDTVMWHVFTKPQEKE
jgi:hypothetical protein